MVTGMKPNFSENRENLQKLLKKYGVDAAWITSRDPFLSEYTPRDNNHRFGITGFTGSIGEAVFECESMKTSLMVDGRYHIQADQEVDAAWVNVVKIEVEPQVEGAVFEVLSKLEKNFGRKISIGLVPERFSEAGIARIQEKLSAQGHTLVWLNDEEVTQALGLPGWKTEAPIRYLNSHSTGRSLKSNLESLAKEMKAAASMGGAAGKDWVGMHITCATDDAAFLLNSRGFHLPYSSAVMAYTFFVVSNEGASLIVYLPSSSAKSEFIIPRSEVQGFELVVIQNQESELKRVLTEKKISQVFYQGSTINGWLSQVVMGWLNQNKEKPVTKNSEFKWLLHSRVSKTSEELNSIRRSFLKSSKAIAKTLRWGKETSAKKPVSEKEMADYLWSAYQGEGAVTLSFKTISGAGKNSAIVHYNANSEEKKLEAGELFLLDSGAYYEEGFATDCTRGFFVRSEKSAVQPQEWQKKIYTSALKAAISVFLEPVPKPLTGKEVDERVRSRVKDAGYDYLHGTGHGIGIHVHEEGIRFSTLSQYGQTPFACVSVEPGIYLNGQGGVRIENVVFLIPENETHYRFENIVWVGYDWDLIDVSKLTDAEKAYLKSYEAKCRELNTNLMECPL